MTDINALRRWLESIALDDAVLLAVIENSELDKMSRELLRDWIDDLNRMYEETL